MTFLDESPKPGDPGKLKELAEGNTTFENLTSADQASPHALVFYIVNSETNQRVIDPSTQPPRPIAWVRRFPTRDAADAHRSDVLQAMKQMRGEPEQAWSDVARMSNCPNPALLPRYKGLEMEIHAVPQKEPNVANRNPAPGTAQPGNSAKDGGPGPNPPKPRRPGSKASGGPAKLPTSGSKGKNPPSKARSKKADK